MKRKIIQIKLSFPTIIALCDDGTIWQRRTGERWVEIPTDLVNGVEVHGDFNEVLEGDGTLGGIAESKDVS